MVKEPLNTSNHMEISEQKRAWRLSDLTPLCVCVCVCVVLTCVYVFHDFRGKGGEREKEKEEGETLMRERNIDRSVASPTCPDWGSNPQPLFLCTRRCPDQLSHPARADSSLCFQQQNPRAETSGERWGQEPSCPAIAFLHCVSQPQSRPLSMVAQTV